MDVMSVVDHRKTIIERIRREPEFVAELLSEALALLEDNEVESAKMILRDLIDAASNKPQIKYRLEDLMSEVDLSFPCIASDEMAEWQNMKPVGKEVW
jgi:hypothetical protein